MTTAYLARWISPERAQTLKRTGALRPSVLLDSFKGPIIVEPVGSTLGDGKILSQEMAEFELQPSSCLEPKEKLMEARRLLNLSVPDQAVPRGKATVSA